MKVYHPFYILCLAEMHFTRENITTIYGKYSPHNRGGGRIERRMNQGNGSVRSGLLHVREVPSNLWYMKKQRKRT